MSKPTILSPWFVVMVPVHGCDSKGNAIDDITRVTWFTEAEGDETQLTDDRTQARLFNSIHSATRVARAAGGYCVVVADEEALKEYRPKGL